MGNLKIVKVDRKLPENWRECDALQYTSDCRQCAYGNNVHTCEKRKQFFSEGAEKGELEFERVEGEYFYKAVI